MPIALARDLRAARERAIALVEDLSPAQLLGPRLPVVNPLLWELGHVAWFEEKWCLRRAGRAAVRDDADRLYDSAAVAHATRWDLPLPDVRATVAYAREVSDRTVERLEAGDLAEGEEYYFRLVLAHEDMHAEAVLLYRQTLGYPAPAALVASARTGDHATAACPDGDVEVPGGTRLLGADPGEPFVFDNEKWAHEVEVPPFRIARCAVTQGAFADFVDDGGYARRELWTPEGWTWRTSAEADRPLHWRRDGGAWTRRAFDAWVPLERDLPMVHVGWHEAQAWCRWAGRRLPTEAEWEVAAAAGPGGVRRRAPWGDAPATPERANLDQRALGCVPVAALPAGDSALGCRQMFGNVWEWTASTFAPYPGFVVDPYAEYSAPWFGTHRVLRGGAWTTSARLLRTTWRNFYEPDRRDVWAGFRTCADDEAGPERAASRANVRR